MIVSELCIEGLLDEESWLEGGIVPEVTDVLKVGFADRGEDEGEREVIAGNVVGVGAVPAMNILEISEQVKVSVKVSMISCNHK